MARSKVVDCDYYHFLGVLRRATDAGTRIEKKDARWAEYVKSHSINEVAASAIARQKFENSVAVIIAEGGADDGLYFYSKNEEAALRLVAIE